MSTFLNLLIILGWVVGAALLPLLLSLIRQQALVRLITLCAVSLPPIALLAAWEIGSGQWIWLFTASMTMVSPIIIAWDTGKEWQEHHHSTRVVEVEVEREIEVPVHEVVPTTNPPAPGQWPTPPRE